MFVVLQIDNAFPFLGAETKERPPKYPTLEKILKFIFLYYYPLYFLLGSIAKAKTQINGEHPRSNEDLLGDLMAPDTNLASNGIDSLNLLDLPAQTQSTNMNNLAPSINTGKESSNIFDLLGTLDIGGGVGGIPSTNNSNNSIATNNVNNLMDGLSSPSNAIPSKSHLPTNLTDLVQTTSLTNNALDTLPGIFSSMPTAEALGNIAPKTVYEKNGVKIVFSFVKPGETGQITINLTATSDATTSISDFVIQAAVPKSMQLQLEPPSGSTLPPVINQVLKINNPNKATLKMKLKVSFVIPGAGPIEEQLQLNTLPPELNTW